MAAGRRKKYLTKIVEFQGTKLTMYSLDGLVWSTRKEELAGIKERLENARITLGSSTAEESEAAKTEVPTQNKTVGSKKSKATSKATKQKTPAAKKRAQKSKRTSTTKRESKKGRKAKSTQKSQTKKRTKPQKKKKAA